MITLLATAMFLVVLAVLWGRWHSNYPALALRYLCLAPFLPLVSLSNHNFDGDRFGTLVRTLPIYVALAFLALSLYGWKQEGGRVRLGRHGVYLIIYAVFSLVQVPFSVDPAWALTSWSFTVPGYVLFLIAGRATTIDDLIPYRRNLLLVMIGFVAINLSLIAYGLSIGKATDLFYTRNFGSVWASNSTLAFLMLFGGLVWIAIRGSRRLTWAFSVTILLGIILSLSKSALLVLAVYLGFVTVASGARSQAGQRRLRRVIPLGGALLTVGGAFVLLRQRLSLDTQLVSSWIHRLSGDALSIETFELRKAQFAPYASEVWHGNPVYGKGFGTFKHFSSEYSDAHNLFITEAFENSLLAAVFLVLAVGLPVIFRSLLIKSLRPLGLSILGFLAIGQITGAMLSYRTLDNYYAVYPGWILFFMVGIIAGKFARRTAMAAGAGQSSRHQQVLQPSA